MVAKLEREIPLDLSFGSLEKRKLRERIVTTLGLGILAIFAYKAETNGVDAAAPEMVRIFLQSCAHPVLGYVGAWLGTEVAVAVKAPKLADEAALAAAVVMDFATEIGQSAISTYIPQALEWWNDVPETTKDFAFAMAGTALFMYQSRQADAQAA